MALFENFPYTNLHELNLDWLINEIKKIEESQVISVNGETGEVILYQDAQMLLPSVSDDHWSIGRITDGTYRGIMFGNDNKAYIVHGNQMAQLYGVNNPPPYPVNSVNGQTGDVILYASAAVQLPSLTDAQLHNWNIFRDLNGVMRGIQFDDSGIAYLIEGTNRYELFSSNNPAHKEASVQLPGLTDAQLHNWNIWRNLNGTASGIQFNDDGSVSVIFGSNRYNVYTSNNPPAYPVTSVNGQTGAVSLNIPDAFVDDPSVQDLTIAEDIPDSSVWALLRETENGYVGISVNNGVNPGAYLQLGTGASAQRIKLLTLDDIPSTSGVVSVNGLSGVVTLSGADLNVSTTDTRKINVVIASLESRTGADIPRTSAPGALTIDQTLTQFSNSFATADANIKASIAYNEDTDTATHNINAGEFVIWKGHAYTAASAIAIGDTLSSTNLTAVTSEGIANVLNNNLVNLGNSTKWKYVGATSGNEVINLPTGWNEVIIQTTYLNTNFMVTHFTKEMFATSHNVSLGSFGTSYAIGTFTPTQFNVLSLYYNGAENITSARTHIYYR